MALVLKDRVKETSTTTGTGTVTLLGASTGYQSFSAIGNANTTYYAIAGQTGSEWEVGIGTYTSSGTTLARTTVLASSNSGSLVNFSAGTKDVFVTYPATYTVNTQTGTATTATNITGTLLVANGGTGLATLTANNVVLGAGTSAVTFVAPGSNGNLLTSNGTTWTSAAAPSGGVTSAVAGNGITVSGATGAVTISQDIYTGSSATNLSLPVGSYVIYFAPTASSVNTSVAPKLGSFITANDSYYASGTGGTLSGTWRTRGIFGTFCTNGYLLQRTA